MKSLIFALAVLPFLSFGQHTFSIVAVDSVTGEIGSAGATCGDSIIWPGTPGAYIISDVIPGVGAIHTQSYYHETNQKNANNRMDLGDSPSEIIKWLEENDYGNSPNIRQYGIVDYNDGSPRAAAYTGSDCMDYKNHIVGPNYSIQGNILLGQHILDSMESGFNKTEGCLSDKLMSAMQGANVVGADSRCKPEGTSSLSAFLRVAKSTDAENKLTLDINIAGTDDGVEPIDVLQSKYDAWKTSNKNDCLPLTVPPVEPPNDEIGVYPNPANNTLYVMSGGIKEFNEIRLMNSFGQTIMVLSGEMIKNGHSIDVGHLPNGLYLINIEVDGEEDWVSKVVIRH
ncbi:MAG: DUF1028 domain-containing protein [Bacteroidetes bacterium]|nr:DUF1028 domain-containing protein [Bacteroidota bacterium]